MIRCCGRSNCTLGAHQRFVEPVVCNTTGKVFRIKHARSIHCDSRRVVYLVTCRKCSFQYIGQTKRALSTRIKEHLSSIRNNSLDTFLVKHFRSDNHCIDDFQFTVLQQLSYEVSEDDSSEVLRKAETKWIKTMVTIYPFGLNDQVDGYGAVHQFTDLATLEKSPYFSEPTPRRRRGRGIHPNHFRAPRTTVNLKNGLGIISRNNIGYMSKICALLRNSPKTELAVLAEDVFFSDRDIALEPWMINIVRAYMAGFFSNKISKPHKFTSNISIEFVNKGIEKIRLYEILKDKRFIRAVPEKARNLVENIRISYRYDAPASLWLCNYNKVLRNLDINTLLRITNSPCKCSNSPFVYSPAKHVITGDLNFIQDPHLKTIFGMGSKFRMPQTLDWDRANQAMVKSITTFLRSVASKSGLPIGIFSEARENIYRIMYNRISFLKTHYRDNDAAVDLCNFSTAALGRLHKQYVVVPADKAGNNFVFVCKKYYLLKLCEELGVDVYNGIAEGNEVYKRDQRSVEEIIQKHVVDSLHWDIRVPDHDLVLPKLFAIPKLHKSPYGFRYIAGGRKSSSKPINSAFLRVIDSFDKHLHNYCEKIMSTSGRSLYWIIANSQQAKSRLQSVKNPNTIITADFSTLFTSLPQQDVINQLQCLNELCFHNANKKYLCIGYNYYFYSNVPSDRVQYCYTSEDISKLIKWVVQESYVTFAGFVFKQVVEIPMGGPSSPLIANLTLAMHELNFLKKYPTLNIRGVSRYIDDICVINCPNFMDLAAVIYPSQIVINRTNPDEERANFLDLSISIKSSATTGRKYCHFNLYDKTRDFNFRVLKFGSAISNVYTGLGYSTFVGQTIRAGRICSDKSDFITNVRKIAAEILAKNYVTVSGGRPNNSNNLVQPNQRYFPVFSKDKLLTLFFGIFERHRTLQYKYNTTNKVRTVMMATRIFRRLDQNPLGLH